jgi:transposase
VAWILKVMVAREGVTMAGRIGPIAWQESAEDLYAQYRHEGEVRRRQRLQVLWLVRQGRSARQAAEESGIGVRTVTRWLGWYRQGGLATVLARVPGHGAPGSASRLTPAQQGQLVAEASAGTFRTYDEARRWVAETFGVVYSYQGIYSLLRQVGIRPKVPRPQAAKADPAAQQDWKKGA